MKKQPPKPDQRGALITAAVGVVLIVVMVVAVVAASRGPQPSSAPSQQLTLDATTISNLTRIPAAPALSGEAAQPYVELGQMIDACADFDETHRMQMRQHLTWLLDPSAIPSNILVGVGPDPIGKLLFGMGSFAQNQWLQIDNSPGSCVVPVGKRLNELLKAAGQPTFKVFEG